MKTQYYLKSFLGLLLILFLISCQVVTPTPAPEIDEQAINQRIFFESEETGWVCTSSVNDKWRSKTRYYRGQWSLGAAFYTTSAYLECSTSQKILTDDDSMLRFYYLADRDVSSGYVQFHDDGGKVLGQANLKDFSASSSYKGNDGKYYKRFSAYHFATSMPNGSKLRKIRIYPNKASVEIHFDNMELLGASEETTPPPPPSGTFPIYTDKLGTGVVFGNWGISFQFRTSDPTPKSGANSLYVAYSTAWAGLGFNFITPYTAKSGDSIELAVHFHQNTNENIVVQVLSPQKTIYGQVNLKNYIGTNYQSFQIAKIPLSHVGISAGQPIGTVAFLSDTNNETVFDDIKIVTNGGNTKNPTTPPPSCLVAPGSSITTQADACVEGSIYGDFLQLGWRSESWGGTFDFAYNIDGRTAIRANLNLQTYGAINLLNGSSPYTRKDWTSIKFKMKPVTVSFSNLYVVLANCIYCSTVNPEVYLSTTNPISLGNGWYDITIPLGSSVSSDSPIVSFFLYSRTTGELMVDDIRFSKDGVSPPPANPNHFLAFPLLYNNWSPYTAEISGVLDHYMTTGGNCGDNIVVTYTNERGEAGFGRSSWSTDNGCGNVYGFMQQSKGEFSLGGQYTGGNDGKYYIFYDGHTGYDYPVPVGTSVYAAAPGIACPYNGTPDPDVVISHANGFETYYLHLQSRTITSCIQIYEGDLVGNVGSKAHLHFTVKKDGQRADPYGWKGPVGTDPLKVNGKDNVCLWKQCP